MSESQMKLSEIIAFRVQDARKKMNMTVEQVAAEANIGIQTLKQLESGKTDCYVSTLYNIATVLGVSFNYLFGKSESNSDENLLMLFNSLSPEKRGFVEGLIYQVKLSPYELKIKNQSK